MPRWRQHREQDGNGVPGFQWLVRMGHRQEAVCFGVHSTLLQQAGDADWRRAGSRWLAALEFLVTEMEGHDGAVRCGSLAIGPLGFQIRGKLTS